jgi:hypothetical protein
MTPRLVQVTFTARDDAALRRFWAEALGPDVARTSPGVRVAVAAVPETARGRVHLDLATTSPAHQAELVARLRGRGATPADIGQGEVPWTVLADPEGNLFCVLEPRDAYRGTGPLAAVVVDCADPRAMARFWATATDWTPHEVTDDYAALRPATGAGPYLEFLRTPGGGTARNRLRLDLIPRPGDDRGDWTVRTDPEGNEFRVLTPR